mmetsp:Transcript_39523/g.109785  ORF Transcript_39523/g.109785 Transcript_39523/m.109785 type:complete len:90 (-) Transcript_39523:768-1037(-)
MLHINSLRLGERGSPEGVSLHREDLFAVLALAFCYIAKTFNPQNVSKVHTIFNFASWARTIGNEFVFEDEFLCDLLRSIVHKRETKKEE